MPGKEHLVELESLIGKFYQKPVKYILNTHDHEDHTGGNAYFEEKGIKVLSESTKLTGIDEIVVASHRPKDRVFFHRERQ